MLTATFHSTLPDGSADAPEWVHLVPAGSFKGVDGRGPYRLTDAVTVIQTSMARGRLPIDENHATDHAMASGQPSPARGWITEMQAREDGIWGRIDWTASGRALMADRAYRGFSPVFTHDKAGTVLQLLRAALTNTPNLSQLATLHTTTGSNIDITRLRAALGLPETADEAACLEAVTRNATAVATHSASLLAIATAAGAPAAQTPDAIVTALQSQRSTMVPVDRVIALQTQLDTMVADQSRAAAIAFVDGAIRDGKPIVSIRDQIIARHIADRADAEAMVNGLPSIHAGGMRNPSRNSDDFDGETMTAEDMSVCEKMGMDPKKFAANKKKMRETAGAMA